MTNKFYKSDCILVASESLRTFADGDRLDIQEYLDSFQDGRLYLENTSLSSEEFSLLDSKELLDVALVDADGNHVLFPRVQPFQAQWVAEKLNEEEYARVYKVADAITVVDYKNICVNAIGIKAVGERAWFCLKNIFSEFEYDIFPSSDGDFFLKIDLQDSDNETVALDREELLADAIQLLNDRIEHYEEDSDLVKCLEEQKKPLELALKDIRLGDKMMDLLGEEVWEVIKFNLDTCDYRLRVVSDSEFCLIDLCYDKDDERIISKLELLKFFVDDVENRIHALGAEDSKPHKKDLAILREAIAMEEVELHRTRATRLEKHMTNKTVAKILDEWLDMQSYTVYIDEFGQLYYIDEIKANNKDRAEHIQAISLHDIVKLIINEIETAILDATLNEIYDDEEIEELYRRDLRILKAYARW